MTVHEQDRPYTADDLWQFALEGKHCELIQGVLYETTPLSETHGVISAELLLIIGGFVKAHKLGRIYNAKTGFELTPHDVLAPNVGFVSSARLTKRTDKFAKVAPDLAIEVVSPSNTRVEMQEKVTLYFAAGTRQVWIVYPRSRAVHVYYADNQVIIYKQDDVIEGRDVLPGFSVKVADIFGVLDEE